MRFVFNYIGQLPLVLEGAMFHIGQTLYSGAVTTACGRSIATNEVIYAGTNTPTCLWCAGYELRRDGDVHP